VVGKEGKEGKERKESWNDRKVGRRAVELFPFNFFSESIDFRTKSFRR